MIITTKAYFEKIKDSIPDLNCKNFEDKSICLSTKQMDMLEKLFLQWNKNNMFRQVDELLNDILKQPDTENGKVYEALVYAWLSEHSIRYIPQVHVDKVDCFKQTEKGYVADGKILKNIFFDVKRFGIGLPLIEKLKKELQEKMLERYYLTISGGKNISTKELTT